MSYDSGTVRPCSTIDCSSAVRYSVKYLLTVYTVSRYLSRYLGIVDIYLRSLAVTCIGKVVYTYLGW